MKKSLIVLMITTLLLVLLTSWFLLSERQTGETAEASFSPQKPPVPGVSQTSTNPRPADTQSSLPNEAGEIAASSAQTNTEPAEAGSNTQADLTYPPEETDNGPEAPNTSVDPIPSGSKSVYQIPGAINPDAVILPINQNTQETSYYCVPACAQAVLDHHGIQVGQDILAAEMNTSSVTGTEYVDLARVINRYLFGLQAPPREGEAGYRVQTLAIGDRDPAKYELFAERVKQGVKSGYPVFAAIDLLALYPELFTGNHLITIVGYLTDKTSGKITDFYYLDPSYRVRDGFYGGLKRATAKELFEAIITNEEPGYIW